MDQDDITIRRATTEDALALGRLAQLDETLYSGADVLVAESEGELIAALPLGGGRPFADPFRATTGALAVLALRREQLVGADAAARGGLGGRWRTLLRARARLSA